MAKRKRLTPSAMTAETPQDGMMPATVPRSGFVRLPPVAQVAGDAAAQAALAELSAEIQAARQGGRIVLDLPLASIAAAHLLRDRMVYDTDDMAALKASLRARGQQTPIEVVDLGGGRYGLISGARRLMALQELLKETQDPRFGQIQALIRSHAAAPDAYLAMVEENEIRADVSFYERGRLVAEAARLGVYDGASAAVKHLFANTTPSRRSKILSFVAVHDALGDALRFPEAIPERLGLALAAAIGADSQFAKRLKTALAGADCRDAQTERVVLEQALRPAKTSRKAVTETVARSGLAKPSGDTIQVSGGVGKVMVKGAGVTDAFLADLRAWLAARA
jgi:ParB family chromosome partitioning protein